MRPAWMIALGVALAVGSQAPSLAAPPVAKVPAAIRSWQGEELAEGLTLYRGTLGDPSGPGAWTTALTIPGDFPGVLGGYDDAVALATRAIEAGFDARVEAVPWAGYAGATGDPLGWRVRAGSYRTREAAAAEAARLKAAGFAAAPEWTRTDPVEVAPGGHSARVRVAIVDPRRYRGRITASYGRAVALPETTTSMARAAGATLAVNGGYFVLHDRDGLTGTLAGVGVYGGELESLPTNGRAALLLGDRPRVARLSATMTVTGDGGGRREIDGVNRMPGLIRNCGGVGGDSPTELPRHDVTCTDPSELVLFTPALGRDTPRGDGVEVVLDGEGRVQRRRPRGGPVPAGGRVLAGIGEGAAWLIAHAPPGARLDVRRRVYDEYGRVVDLAGADVVNGGPDLIRDGRVSVDVIADGVLHEDDPAFFYTWGIKRNPRAMVGVDRWGRIILVTADGRRPGYSDGLSLLEGARFLRELGAVEAINLDGGGSVSLVVRGRLDNRPSGDGERKVGDALLFLPAGKDG